MFRWRPLLLVALLLATPAADAAKRRAIAKPSVGDTAPEGWLAANSFVLSSTELTPSRADLAPLALIGSASVVGLADDTHGTHEFYTMKLRVIDHLVHEMGFDVLAFEGSFPIFERINVYAQGGPGNPRALLAEARTRLLYLFWDVEEMLAVIEWVRDYNLHRGARPAVEIAGFDMYDEEGAMTGVLGYLQQVDPAAAMQANTDYQCVRQRMNNPACRSSAQGVYDRLLAHRAGYQQVTGARAVDDAVQYATVILQFFNGFIGTARDQSMASNALWIRDHRGVSRKVMLWAHQEHLGKTISPIVGGASMGLRLHTILGRNYFVLGTLTGDAAYLTWERNGSDFTPVSGSFPAPAAGSYESSFRLRRSPIMLIPLRPGGPSWLVGPAAFRTAGTTAFDPIVTDSLPEKLDAVIYIETTTPTKPLR